MRTYKVRMIWEDRVWHSVVDDPKFGLTLEAGSFDVLVERIRVELPEMLEDCYGYTGPIHIDFESECTITTRGLSEDGGLHTYSQEVAV